MIIWRDDDVGQNTRLDVLTAVDDIFQRYALPHTIAVIASGLDARQDLIDLIRDRRMIVQLHCWEHDDLSIDPDARADLERAMDLLGRLFDRPTVLYPPWNRSSAELEEKAATLGLTVSHKKVSLSQYIRVKGGIAEDVVNFHHWHVPDAVLIEPALRIATASSGK